MHLNKILKWVLISFVLIFLCWLLVSSFQKNDVITTAKTNLPVAAVNRILQTDSLLQSFLPENVASTGYTATIRNTGLSSKYIELSDKENIINIQFFTTILGPQNTNVLFHTTIKGKGGEPSFLARMKIKRTLQPILNEMAEHLEKESKNDAFIYGVKFFESHLHDSTLITIAEELNHYPSIREVDSLVAILDAYRKQNLADTTNFPMLNVRRRGDNYLCMVAIPVNRDLASSKNIIPKRMLPGGKFITCQAFSGGMATVQKMENGIQHYFEDHGYSSPAIPFQSMIVKRSAEQDTNLWQTRLFYPVF